MATETPKTQIGDEIRVMTADEIAALELTNNENDARAKQEADRQELKKTALAKLGLTADEVTALLS